VDGVRTSTRRLLGLRHRLIVRVPPWEGGAGRKSRVVITGSGGLIGGIIRAGLGDEYALRGVDRMPGTGVDVVADIRRQASARRVLEGADAVIDLAANADPYAPWTTVCDDDVRPALSVFEAASQVGVHRIVYASSNHVVGSYEQDEPYASVVAGRHDGLDPGVFPRITVDAPARADGMYGAGKAFCEVAGRYYADVAGPSVLCLRIGTVRADDRPARERHFATFLSHRDLVSLVRCCLEAPESLRYGVFFGVSNNTWRLWDIESGRRSLGYEPVDDAEFFRDSLARDQAG
jgi:uronate dehydrogenase